jgi:hypothetical protein
MTHEHTVPCTQESTINALQANQNTISDKVERINHTIHGNGDGIGMKTDLALVVQRTEGLQALIDKNELRKSNNVGLWIAGLSLVLLFVFGLWDHLKNDKNDKEFTELIKKMNSGIDPTTRAIHSPSLNGLKGAQRDSIIKNHIESEEQIILDGINLRNKKK